MQKIALESESEAYSNFINSLDSEQSRIHYRRVFPYFMAFCKVDTYDDMLTIEPKKLEGLIRDYIIHLKENKRSSGTVTSYLSVISHFYEMNDVNLHWKKLGKFKGKHRNVAEDKPYTRDQIKLLLDYADLRNKCLILLMSSAGLRRGALPRLKIQDLTRIDGYKLIQNSSLCKGRRGIFHLLHTRMPSSYRPISRLANQTGRDAKTNSAIITPRIQQLTNTQASTYHMVWYNLRHSSFVRQVRR